MAHLQAKILLMLKSHLNVVYPRGTGLGGSNVTVTGICEPEKKEFMTKKELLMLSPGVQPMLCNCESVIHYKIKRIRVNNELWHHDIILQKDIMMPLATLFVQTPVVYHYQYNCICI